MAYDPAGDRLVSVISLATPTSPGGLELWQRDLGTGVESRSIAPVDADWPENRTEFGLGYDPITNRFVLQGGFVVRREPQYSWSWPSDPAAADHGWNAAAEPKLAIERATFDRASRTVHVTLALARSSEARLVLYDLAGRRLASTCVRSDEPRLAVLPIGPAGPGVYFVQARQDDRAINARVIVTQ